MAWNDLPPKSEELSPQSKWSDLPPDQELKPKSAFSISKRGLLKGVAEALPVAGSLAGGAVGFLSPIPGGTIAGGALGAAGGKALENIIEGQLLNEPKSTAELVIEPLKEGAIDVVAGKGAQLVGKGLLAAGRGVKSLIAEPAIEQMKIFGAPAIQNADEVIAAGKRLGVTPTRGMLTDEKAVQNLESGLSQGAWRTGTRLRKQLTDVGRGLIKAGEETFERTGAPTSLESAQLAKKSMAGKLQSAVEPAVEIYKRIESETPFIEIGEKSARAIAKNIEGLPFAKIVGSSEASFAKNIAETVRMSKSLDEIRNVRSYVGKILGDRNASPTMKQTAGEIYGRLSRLEQNSITRAALAAAKSPQHGRAVAKQMLGEIKQANKIYAEASKLTQDLAQSVGLGKVQNYADFIRKVEAMPDEKFLTKFFNTQNYKALKEFQTQFPQAFDALKVAKQAEIYNQSVYKGELSVPSLIRNAKKLSPEVKELVFGKDAVAKLNDMELVANRIYQKVGPSGTPEGMAILEFNPLSPGSWYREFGNSVKKAMLDRPELFRKGAERLGRIGKPLSQESAKKYQTIELGLRQLTRLPDDKVMGSDQ